MFYVKHHVRESAFHNYSSGCNESLLSVARVQLILCKDNANERQESLLSVARVQLILCKDNNFYFSKQNFATFIQNNMAYWQKSESRQINPPAFACIMSE